MLRTFLKFLFTAGLCFLPEPLFGQTQTPPKIDLTQPQNYVLKRVSSADPTGANADFRKIDPGSTLTLLDTDGPCLLTHIWITVASREAYHLKKLVLRIYWDKETTPSVEAPLGDFFGLGLGEYYRWESELRCPCYRIKMDGGAKVTTCFSWMGNPGHPSTVLVRKIIF